MRYKRYYGRGVSALPVLKLLNNLHPLFISKVGNEYVRTLLDTDATASVWRGSVNTLLDAGAKLADDSMADASKYGDICHIVA